MNIVDVKKVCELKGVPRCPTNIKNNLTKPLIVLYHNQPSEDIQPKPGKKRKKSTKNEKELPNISEEFSNFINDAYSVLKLILSQLEWFDLMNAAQVCTPWKVAAEVIEKERHGVNWFYVPKLTTQRENRPQIMYLNGHQLSRPKLTIILRIPNSCHLEYAHNMIENNKITKCPKKHRILDFLMDKITPSGSDVISAKIEQLNVLFHLPHVPNVPNNILDQNCAFAGFMIPDIPNVKMSKFRFDMGSPLFGDVFKSQIGEGRYLKCVLLFCSFQESGTIYEEKGFLELISKYQGNEPFACGGAYVLETRDEVNPPRIDSNEYYAIVFSVPKNKPVSFRATSFYLDPGIKSKQHIHGVMEKVVKYYQRRQHEIALRFACVRRKKLTHLELECFATYFPKIPIMSLDGFGEFGTNCVPDAPSEADVNSKGDKELMRFETTAFVILSWGDAVVKK